MLWWVLPYLLLFTVLSRFPQVRSIWDPSWTFESGGSLTMYIASWTMAVMLWLASLLFVLRVEFVLSEVAADPFIVFCDVDTPTRVIECLTNRVRPEARITTLLVLSAATLGAAFTLVNFVMTSALREATSASGALVLFLLLGLANYLGAVAWSIHQSINYRRTTLAAFAFLPVILFLAGVFMVDSVSRVVAGVCLTLLSVVPCIFVAQFGAPSLNFHGEREFDQRNGEEDSPQGRVGFAQQLTMLVAWLRSGLPGCAIPPLIGSAVAFFAIWTWNGVDQDAYVHQHEQENRAAPTHPWRDVRSGASRLGLPPVALNIGGGGSRAAIFGALVLKRLWWMPVAAEGPILTQIRRLPKTAQDLVLEGKTAYPGRLMLLSTRFVSSISGGSLISAHWNYAVQRNLPKEARNALEARATALRHTMASPAHSLFSQRGNAWDSKFTGRVEQDPMVYAMTRNYLAPTILGIFDFGGSRIEAIRKANESYAYLTTGQGNGAKGVELASLIPDESSGRLPYLMFNATVTTTGERFVVTNVDQSCFDGLPTMGPKLDRSFLREDCHNGEQTRYRFQTQPGRVLAHTTADPKWWPTLATAAWISGDFPYGFPVNRIKMANCGDTIATTDGGVLDNLGSDTTMSLFRSLAKKSKDTVVDEIGERRLMAIAGSGSGDESAKSNELPFRSFFVFDIDTSAMFLDPAPSPAYSYHYGEASNAQARAKQVSEQALWRLYISELASLTASVLKPIAAGSVEGKDGATKNEYVGGFQTEAGAPYTWAWFRSRTGEKWEDNVSTSWYLNPSERQVLYRIALGDLTYRLLKRASLSYLEIASNSLVPKLPHAQNE